MISTERRGRKSPTRIQFNRCSKPRHYASLRSHDTVIRVYDEAGKVIKTHEHAGEFKDW